MTMDSLEGAARPSIICIPRLVDAGVGLPQFLDEGGGLLQGIQDPNCDGVPLPWGLRGVKGGAGFSDGGESGILEGLSGKLG